MTGRMRTLLRGKVHRATVTQANLDYEGSITMDRDLMDAAGIEQFEQVHVLDINNGARLTTYAIEGQRGSGVICLNGAAARLVDVGDLVIILAYEQVPQSEVHTHEPALVYVDGANRVTRVGHEIAASAG